MVYLSYHICSIYMSSNLKVLTCVSTLMVDLVLSLVMVEGF